MVTSSVLPQHLSFRVVSYNIRNSDAHDGRHAWEHREASLVQEIRLLCPDVFGLQEVTHLQWENLRRLLPEYEFVGIGRDDGKTAGEYSPVCYRREQFYPVDHGFFWLSETPDTVGSCGWDAACIRIASWVILGDRESGKEFFFLNTHVDHVGRRAMAESSLLILQRSSLLSEGRPVIVTGDFNAAPEDESIRLMTGAPEALEKAAAGKKMTADRLRELCPRLADTRLTAEASLIGPGFTFHDFRLPELLLNPAASDYAQTIDYIFTSQNVVCRQYAVASNMAGDLCISDHLPVAADLII